MPVQIVQFYDHHAIEKGYYYGDDVLSGYLHYPCLPKILAKVPKLTGIGYGNQLKRHGLGCPFNFTSWKKCKRNSKGIRILNIDERGRSFVGKHLDGRKNGMWLNFKYKKILHQLQQLAPT